MTVSPHAESTTDRPVVRLLAGHAKRARRGYPWIFSNEVRIDAEAKSIPAGTMVAVLDAGEERLGVGSFNPHSLIAVRLFDRDPAAFIGSEWLKDRLRRATALRERLWDGPYGRLVHGEADGLPGLIIDRFDDIFAVQLNTAGMDALRHALTDALQALFQPRTIVFQNTSPVRSLEGLPLETTIEGATLTEPVAVMENGFRYFADLGEGQKTGWFYDQRRNRAFVASLAKGRAVLDVCSYAGGFGLLALANGARSTLFVDRSPLALALAERAADAAGLRDGYSSEQGDAFDTLETLARAGKRFEVVVCDPPAFAKSRKDIGPAAKGYRKMARLGAAVTAPGGIFFMASCSHHMEATRFSEEVIHGLAQAGRSGRVLRLAGAAPDHPIHPLLPESAYLKTITFQID